MYRKDASQVPAATLRRPQYAAGSYLAASDLLTEQHCRWQRLRRHNRYLHGWGVVCGLWVVPGNDAVQPWAVLVCPGYAIGPCGDEIELKRPAMVNIQDYAWKRQPSHELTGVAYVVIRHAEQLRRPVPVKQPMCGCDNTVYEPSRIRDCFQLDVLWTLQQIGGTASFDLCEQQLAPCPDRPESLDVVLAGVTLPASEGDPITRNHIDNFTLVRRQLSGTSTLQEQLIAYCCEEKATDDPSR